MTSTATCISAVDGERSFSPLSSKKVSASDMELTLDVPHLDRTEANGTSGASAEDSRGCLTPDYDSIELKLSATSPPASASSTAAAPGPVKAAAAAIPHWSSVQEALEAFLDATFLAGQAALKDETVVDEVLELLDSSLTAHVPALAGLVCLQPLLSGMTRSERLDAILCAARASAKLMLRDDLPVPSSNGWILSIDEAEAAALRIGARTHADGQQRCTLLLEPRRAAVSPPAPAGTAASAASTSATANTEAAAAAALRSATLRQLQTTVPMHKIVKLDRPPNAAAASIRVIFVSPTAAERAYTMWRSRSPLRDIRIMRVCPPGTVASFSTSTPQPRSVAAAAAASACAGKPAPAVPAPRTVLRCPCVVGESLSRPFSEEDVTELQDSRKSASIVKVIATVPPAVMKTRPPPAIDADLSAALSSGSSAAAATAATAIIPTPVTAIGFSPNASTTSTTPAAESSSKSRFNMNATPFLPKSVLRAQMSGAAGNTWCPPRTSGTGRIETTEKLVSPSPATTGADPIDTSEALANQMLLDSSTGWMYAALDSYNSPSWPSKLRAGGEAWEGTSRMCSSAAAGAASVPAARPRSFKREAPVAPCALGDSPDRVGLPPIGSVTGMPLPHGVRSTAMDRACSCSLTPCPPLAVNAMSARSLLAAHTGMQGSLDNVNGTRTPPLSQQRYSASRRHRHDPYSPSGYVLCGEHSSCASSLSQAPTAASVTPGTGKYLFSASMTGKHIANFCFEDPLIQASARRRERRRLLAAAAAASGLEPCSSGSTSSSDGVASHRETSAAHCDGRRTTSGEEEQSEECMTQSSNSTFSSAALHCSSTASVGAEAVPGVTTNEEEEASGSTGGAAASLSAAAVESATSQTSVPAEAGAIAAAVVPRSYAEALRLKAKVLSATPAAASKPLKNCTVIAAKKTISVPAVATNGSRAPVKTIVKSKKALATA